MRVLVTGSAGAIGRAVAPHLRLRGHHVRGFDRVEHDGCDETVIGQLSDATAVDRAVEGSQVIVHFAAAPDDALFVEHLVEPNVVGLFRVFDAARRLGVGRVIYASSIQVISGLIRRRRQRGEHGPVRLEEGVEPTNHYALTKVWAESMARMYSRRWGMETIGVRIGWFVRNVVEARHIIEHQAVHSYLSRDDACRFFAAAVEASIPRPIDADERAAAHVLYAVSYNGGRPSVDLEPARRVIAYEPRDSFPDGLGFELPQDLLAPVRA